MLLVKVSFVALIYHEFKDNWPKGSNFASASARRRRYFIFGPEFEPQVFTHTHAIFLYEVKSFTNNEDKFGWVKY